MFQNNDSLLAKYYIVFVDIDSLLTKYYPNILKKICV